jgi:hypothetical protein
MKPAIPASLTALPPAAIAWSTLQVHLLATVAGQRRDRLDALPAVSDALARQAVLKERLRHQHDERILTDVHAAGQFTRELGIERKSDPGEKIDRFRARTGRLKKAC